MSPTPTQELRSARVWFAAPALLAGLQKEFFSHWKEVARGFDVDEVHDLRVASRRLREGLALFSPFFSRKKLAKLSKEIKKVTRVLGSLRNTDEAVLFFSALEAAETSRCRGETDELVRSLAAEREETREGLERKLRAVDAKGLAGKFRALLRKVAPFKEHQADPFTPMSLYAGQALAERAGQAEGLLPAAVQESDAAAQHRLRIAIKKLRYRLEIIAPLLDDGGEELRLSLKGYQDLLGKLHDIDVFTELVRERVPEGEGGEELLLVLARHRSGLFASFLEETGTAPLSPLIMKVTDALAVQQGRPDQEAVRPPPGKPARQKRG